MATKSESNADYKPSFMMDGMGNLDQSAVSFFHEQQANLAHGTMSDLYTQTPMYSFGSQMVLNEKPSILPNLFPDTSYGFQEPQAHNAMLSSQLAVTGEQHNWQQHVNNTNMPPHVPLQMVSSMYEGSMQINSRLPPTTTAHAMLSASMLQHSHRSMTYPSFPHHQPSLGKGHFSSMQSPYFNSSSSHMSLDNYGYGDHIMQPQPFMVLGPFPRITHASGSQSLLTQHGIPNPSWSSNGQGVPHQQQVPFPDMSSSVSTSQTQLANQKTKKGKLLKPKKEVSSASQVSTGGPIRANSGARRKRVSVCGSELDLNMGTAANDGDGKTRRNKMAYPKGTFLIRYSDLNDAEIGQWLWLVDNHQLIQKYMLERVDKDGRRLYTKTERYSGWLSEEGWLYFPVYNVTTPAGGRESWDALLNTLPTQNSLDKHKEAQLSRRVCKTERSESYEGALDGYFRDTDQDGHPMSTVVKEEEITSGNEDLAPDYLDSTYVHS